MQLRIVIACALPFELQVAYFYRHFGQRKRTLALLSNEWLYFIVERQSRPPPRHYHQQRVRTVSAEGSCYWRAYIGRQVLPLKRRPHSHVAVTSDSEHTEQS